MTDRSGALRALATKWTADADRMPFSWDLRRCASDLTRALDSIAASDGGECPHIVTSDEAAEGLRRLDAWQMDRAMCRDQAAAVSERQFIRWAVNHLRPILAATTADPGAAE